SRCQRWAAIVVRVKLSAFLLGELVELLPVQQFVQMPIERMAGCGWQLLMSHPELLLPLPVPASAHRHTNILGRSCFQDQENRSAADFNHGLLGPGDDWKRHAR